MFEKLILNQLFKFFHKNSLIWHKEFHFKLADWCINGFLSITHKIYESLISDLEVSSISLIYQKSLINCYMKGYQILGNWKSQKGISGNRLTVLTDFFKNRKKKGTLNGQTSFLTQLNAGNPQDSILSVLLFLIYTNHLPDCRFSNAKHFADDTPLFFVVHNIL